MVDSRSNTGLWGRRLWLIGFFCLICLPVLKAQHVALKTNTLYWMAGGSTNLEAEVALGRKTSLSLLGVYNPWTFKDDKMMHFAVVQPALKFWFCERFEGHFVGIHVHGAQFYGDLMGYADSRYDGYLAGAGISWGYDWILGKHWNMEFEIGAGINYTWYKRSDCVPCRKYTGLDMHKTFVSPTKVSLSFVYLL